MQPIEKLKTSQKWKCGNAIALKRNAVSTPTSETVDSSNRTTGKRIRRKLNVGNRTACHKSHNAPKATRTELPVSVSLRNPRIMPASGEPFSTASFYHETA